MGEPTWQEITAEAIRRKAQALKDGRGDIELKALIVEITREGWKPPEPVVDPDILAFREWLMKREPDMRRQSYAYDADFWENCLSAQAFLAGARMAREQERERTDHPVAFTVRVMAGVFNSLDHAKREARAALDKHRGEA